MDLLKEFLFQTYQFLASIKVLFWDISFLQLYLGVAGVLLSLGFARMFFGLSGDVVTHFTQRGGNNKNFKTSKERQGDTK